jgi:hypothetical protein
MKEFNPETMLAEDAPEIAQILWGSRLSQEDAASRIMRVIEELVAANKCVYQDIEGKRVLSAVGDTYSE